MNIKLNQSQANQKSEIKVTGSKSETNRLLLLQALYPNIALENTSNSDDSEVMAKALTQNSKPKTQNLQPEIIDIHHAGTAMRFLTAYFATQENREVIITGSPRMKERPIKILVEALQQLGAEITYEENQGFPPLKIKGKKLSKSKVSLPADISSQYVSALLLIAPKLENGLELTLEGKITSIPYIKMTLAILNDLGFEASFVDNTIAVKPKLIIHNSKFIIESDWSSASYFYSIVALSDIGTEIKLSSYKENSLQGDSVLSEIYKNLGVETTFENHQIILKKASDLNQQSQILDLNEAPDIAQTIAVTCFGLGIGCHLTGLHTLKIKETDRLEALRIELQKLGANITVTDDSLTLEVSSVTERNIAIDTYNDHRMAMAFAPLALLTDIIINDAEVVSKSFPDFWNDLKAIGFKVEKQ
ncbi:3-phosphoshikimate 1-carboxyvinyltransferase [Flavobacterium macacae]|uniref:3-phosphoshikimate 1-carboxyvinyltransferase n=1 Tax=Flavobacterium macacae TaxID=2488993 RepID=A0A3P3W7J1_9FLAO|nr:3-phosphoshikimate 1-carboxyvinyltransferase [Flavobacterium macacae]RRJ91135.1 3-phosphoshikimate 1-carboxyvinyltransferase [Flavobacterium macacae]